ncbi:MULTISPECIES: DUF2553 family protein [Aneurinibacillus]|jgi:hypothetical protein|uniref:YusG family protein n=1 Tax=Aneurinibacillus thermoaerophilus TaxID=143495 RepID=A0A1G8CJV6_ANETH|nr:MULTISPECIES: DUF2553 family protein [Aneurinibacillus]AMA71936.1 hypothetical protein ACH33_03165 [Aneurinibacillus sp. XH2]MED0675512.1 DUF2553 family protein [Aneurinibacillus thermoaerophilus]MED0680279.1 DUF2553 family protein [Aneurinibacillus thermoaerophilus]MED0737094.1 DUF2553 family protein [Aneurinibacillus thermoaerophilus]MED0758724.1 DUF2553 family protein [Aneurinibacillus thermoaerophilus]
MSQQPDVNRIDVTKQVRGEVTEDCIVLTLNGREIGHIPFDAASCTMNAGYMVEQQRIFRIDSADTVHPSSYVDNCDMGWC